MWILNLPAGDNSTVYFTAGWRHRYYVTSSAVFTHQGASDVRVCIDIEDKYINFNLVGRINILNAHIYTHIHIHIHILTYTCLLYLPEYYANTNL